MLGEERVRTVCGELDVENREPRIRVHDDLVCGATDDRDRRGVRGDVGRGGLVRVAIIFNLVDAVRVVRVGEVEAELHRRVRVVGHV